MTSDENQVKIMQLNPLRPRLPEVVPLAHAYLAKPGNSVGGNLHVVLEDLNVKDYHVEFCRDAAIADHDLDGVLLASALLLMSQTQRLKVATYSRRGCRCRWCANTTSEERRFAEVQDTVRRAIERSI